ncbi:mechanosensitive ion channel domain-containing protein [Roseovarius aestuariivivens]|uniref:mechanosensitive ion channel domain-containing protein n=1 Tax=Roseovarius aestuariivivens TaxID=1888910 RepID=UPI001AEBB907|nr:mechanosensitive ion channel domain-containing protein [Roseovarius aestuariivivens]
MSLFPRVRLCAVAFTLILMTGFACLAPAAAQEQGGGSGQADAQADSALSSAPLDALLDVLKDDAARQSLIDALGSAAQGGDTGQSSESAVEQILPDPGQTPSIGAQIAEFTQSIAEDLAGGLASLTSAVKSGGSVFEGLSGAEFVVILESFKNLALVIVITVAVYLTLRRLMRPVFQKMGARAADANFLRSLFIFLGSTALDVIIVLLAWALGYAITLLALGEYAQMGFRQALYLNAFLLVELIKVAIRAIVSPTTGGLRLINLSNRAARKLNRHASVVVSVLGYGQLLVVPIVNRNVSFAAGLGVSALLSLFVLFYLVVLVIRHRDHVANWIARRLTAGHDEEETDEDMPDKERLGGFLGTLTRTWHWFTLAYLLFMFFLVVSRPTSVVVDYLVGSGKVLMAALLGSLVIGGIGKSLRAGVHLPEDLRHKIPLLEPRLNNIVPKVLTAVRILVALAVVAYSLDVTGLIDVGGWLASAGGISFSARLLSVLGILLVAAIIWLALNSWVDYKLNPDYGTAPTSRETTLLTLLRNAATIALLVLTLMLTLSEIGLDIGPLLASAGVLGLAIGFGAQKFVQDIITGVFIQFENAINVGDVVTVGGTTGTVEKLTVRSVSLRDVQGTYHIIPFSSVDMVSNFMRDFSYFVCDMGVAYREDIEEAKQAMFDGFAELRDDPDFGQFVIDELEWFGLNSFGDSAVVLRARIKTIPGKQWGVGRAYNGILKRIFDERGIEIPFPHQTIFFGEAKDGSTQTLRVGGPVAETKGGSGGASGSGDAAKPTSDAKEATIESEASDAGEAKGD